MNNRSIKIGIVIALSIAVISCKREEAVIGPKFAKVFISSFTIDSLLFSVKLNNSPLVDSLASPVASVLKQFPFYDSVIHLQVLEKKSWNRIVIDTNIRIHLGLNYISIVQFNNEEKPVIPAVPNEPLPDAGFCKVKLVYTAPEGAPFPDSVKCVVMIDTSASGNGSATYPADTIVLSRHEFSERYYAVKKSRVSFYVSVLNPVTNAFLRETPSETTTDFTDFNTVNLKAFKITSTNVNYDLERVF